MLTAGVVTATVGGAGVVATGIAGAADAGPAWAKCAAAPPEAPPRVVCADLSVPADWAKPTGPAVTLKLAKLPATDPGHRIGALFVNPGGPGASGLEMVYRAESTLSAGLLERYDLVSFDPRGQAASNPVVCDVDKVQAQAAALNPKNEKQYQALRYANRALGDNCRERTGPVAEHVDSVAVARDMDAIRSAIGEAQVTFYGVSYGTVIGQEYAELFPGRLRGMVLDSVLDHSANLWQLQADGAVAIEESFTRFARWCARTTDCSLHDEDVLSYFDKLYARAEAGELVHDPGTPDEWVTTGDYLIGMIMLYMREPAAWFDLADALRAEGAAGSPKPAVRRAVEQTRMGYLAVLCQDFSFDTHGYAQFDRMKSDLARLAPHTRRNTNTWSWLASCQNWPRGAQNPPHRLQAAKQLPPILLTNSRYDVATPYQSAQSVAAQLPNATLLTYDGVGHADYVLDPCSRQAIDTYLLSGRMPKKGTHCPAVFPVERH
ncbi:alpha/beta hydrolase [Actinoplanes sp. NPDC049265]|uniref:alpha/beta hydrolase n=1 Tax=Actinoplanes sp. NPDC049265 TaxID=3363902 RepID=UPI003719A7B3